MEHLWSSLCKHYFRTDHLSAQCTFHPQKLHYRQEVKKTFLVPVIAAGVMGIAAYLVHRVFNLFAGNTISTILAVCVGAVVYGICLVKLGGILEREIRRLPKGDLLADLLIRLNIL